MDGLINNPLHVVIHLLCFWAGGKIADRTNFFSHNRNSVSMMCYSAWIWISLIFIGAKYLNIHIGFFDGDNPDTISKIKSNWWVFVSFGFIAFFFGYAFTVITARMGITKPYEPEGVWVYGDVCLKTMRNALNAQKAGEKPTSHVLSVLDKNYKSLPWEAASRSWKAKIKLSMQELREIDNRDFEGGSKGLDANDQTRLNDTLFKIDTLLAEAESKLTRCFERRKHKPGQWYR
jgi:hypothetical protein